MQDKQCKNVCYVSKDGACSLLLVRIFELRISRLIAIDTTGTGDSNRGGITAVKRRVSLLCLVIPEKSIWHPQRLKSFALRFCVQLHERKHISTSEALFHVNKKRCPAHSDL